MGERKKVGRGTVGDLHTAITNDARLALLGPQEISEDSPDSPSRINKFDLWGIHDMLIAGYACPACEADAEKRKVEDATVEFAKLLPEIHPIKKCRDGFQAVANRHEGGEGGMPLHTEDMINMMAETSWTCLDKSFTCSSDSWFCTIQDASIPGLKKYASRPSVPAFVGPLAGNLGACSTVNPKETQWSRACSFWSVIHVLGIRADALRKQIELLSSLVPILAGGALLCHS